MHHTHSQRLASPHTKRRPWWTACYPHCLLLLGALVSKLVLLLPLLLLVLWRQSGAPSLTMSSSREEELQ